MNKCLRCGHQWKPRLKRVVLTGKNQSSYYVEKESVRCAKCRSHLWNQPYVVTGRPARLNPNSTFDDQDLRFKRAGIKVSGKASASHILHVRSLHQRQAWWR